MRFFCLFLGALGGVTACGGSTSEDGSSNGGGASSSGGTSAGGTVSTGGNVSSGGSAPCGKLCNGACVSTNDVATGCGTASCEPCNLPHASAACSAEGECVIATCDSGYANCDQGSFVSNTTGCETNIQLDPANCGSCGSGCTAEPGTQPSCVGGSCAASCSFGFGTCGTATCQTPLNTPEHCGSCAKQCSSVNATPACLPTPGATYMCTLTCDAGYEDCDALEENGCEVNVQNDVANCGGCNVLCDDGPHSTAVCANGSCTLVCDAGWLHCNGSIADGCEKQGSSCN